MKRNNNKLLRSYKVRFNTQQEYKRSRRCCQCVYVTETKYAPRSLCLFYWLLKEKGEEGHEEFLSETLSLPPERRGEKKKQRHTNILKSCPNSTCLQSLWCLHAGWMDVWRECELSYDNPESKRKESHSIWWFWTKIPDHQDQVSLRNPSYDCAEY